MCFVIEILKATAFEKCLVSFTISAIELAPAATSCRPIRDLIAEEQRRHVAIFRVFRVFRGSTIPRGTRRNVLPTAPFGTQDQVAADMIPPPIQAGTSGSRDGMAVFY